MKRLLLLYALLLAVSHGVWWFRDTSPPEREGATIVEVPRVGGEGPPVRVSVLDIPPTARPEPDALPLVLIHGSPGSLRDFSRIANTLASNRRVIVPDLPGFGASRQDVPDLSAEAHARYLLHVLDELGVPRAHLAGFSMGGAVQLELANLAPERAGSLAFLSAIGVQELEMFGRHDLNHLVHGGQLALLHAARWLLPHFGGFDTSPLNLHYARNFFDTDQRPLRDYLAAYDGPVFVYHGSEDFLVPVAAAHEHARIAPQAETTIVDANHFVLWTRPDEVASRLAAFLARADGGTARRRSDVTPSEREASLRPYDPSEAPPFTGPTLLVMMVLLVMATFVSEDLTCIATGFVIAQGRLGLVAGMLACFGGLVLGDVMLYLLGRWLGRPAVRRFPLRLFVSEEAVERASTWFEKRGARVVLMARVIPGMRLPTYVAAGVLQTRFWACVGFFAFAAAIWTPLLVGSSAFAGHVLGTQTDLMETSTTGAFVGVAVAFLFVERIGIRLFTHRSRRQLLGSLRKWRRVEFWPWPLVYAPVYAYVVWLALRHRGLRLVTACNPGISTGGLIGESKSAILDGLSADDPRVARHVLLPITDDVASRLAALDRFISDHHLGYPIVIKPDVGERGTGVRIIDDRAAASTLVETATRDLIAQERIEGPEYGVSYERHPDEATGRITSITIKRPETVVGDGRRTLAELIVDHPRAVCMASRYLQINEERLDDVPADGAVVPISSLGNHRLGSLFLDGRHLITPELTEAVDDLARGFEGFHLGRFDLRVPSEDDLRAGRDFRVIELNGLTAEPGHIYDPETGTFGGAWKALLAHWRTAFEIGHALVRKGVRPTTWRELWRAI